MLKLDRRPGEYWWGGAVDLGTWQPLGDHPFSRDLSVTARSDDGQPIGSGQAAPLLVSTAGRVVYSDQPFRVTVTTDALIIEGEAHHVTAGSCLADAYGWAAGHVFHPSGKAPGAELISGIQYNTWIEMPYEPTQARVLDYARSLRESGLPGGVIMVDDNWASFYGEFNFDARRFPDPAALVEQLHQWGYRVMLWIVPFICPDSPVFRELERAGLLLRDVRGDTAIRRWWNGFSAVLDMTNPQTQAWLHQRLRRLMDEFGVDGFKFDAGDLQFYRGDDLSFACATPTQHCQSWAEFGTNYPFNEFRACWQMGGAPLGQRLKDKPPYWGVHGIEGLVPEILAQAMIGHAFTCPDMIGGGEVTTMGGTVDQEFVVRYAQVAALMPMMQFSMNPARILDEEHFALVKAVVALRQRFAPRFQELVDQAAATAIPMVRPLAFECADPLCAAVNDQFCLGSDLIVAPQVHRGASTRSVMLTPGTWVADDGQVFEVADRPTRVEVTTPLARLPFFKRTTESLKEGF